MPQTILSAIRALRRSIRTVPGFRTPESRLALPAPMRLSPDINPEDCLDIPVRDSADQHMREDVIARGRFLARQEMWGEFAAELSTAEAERRTTPAGMPLADLLALGARADVVLAAEHALQDGRPARDAPLSAGIRALEDVLAGQPDCYPMALMVALTHIDIGWAWRGTGWEPTVPRANRTAFNQHFSRAREILGPYCALEYNSPALAAARCALLAIDDDPQARIADDYEDLIDLDPGNHRHMRSLGMNLLPRWFGSYDQLDLEARRTAARTQDVWGDGGYTWVYLDAVATDEQACTRIDVDFFIDGMRDIIAARPDQAMVNLLTAYCAVTLQQRLGFDSAADFIRTRLSECSRWLIRDHLTEIHPLVWAHAAEGLDTASSITSNRRFLDRGRSDAMQAICDSFADDILSGHRVRFTAQGPELHRI